MERPKEVIHTTAKLFHLQDIYFRLPGFVLFIFLSFLFYSPSYGQEGMVYEKTIQVDGVEREYLLYVPSTYSGQEEWPLVLNFHGFNSGPEQQMAFSQMNLAADDAHFLVAYPAGLTVNNPLSDQQGPGWNVINATLSDNDDIDFSRQVVEHILADYRIDHYKIHATGFSMGASMAYEIACLAPDLIASVAAVGGIMDQTIINRCERNKPISLLQIHGTDDPIVPFDGAAGERITFPPAPETAAFWAEQSDCELEPESEDLPDNDTNDNSTVTLFEYQNCDDTEVLFYQISGGGHSWPGGGEFPEFVGAVNRDFDASAEILAFFQRNPHPDLADGGPGELHEYSFMHDGLERNYLLYVPEDYDGQEDWPLVMVFHGFRIDGRFQMEVSQMNPVADKEKFLIAYPEGLPVLYPLTGEIGTGWIIPGAWERDEHQDDVGFVSKVIDDVNDQYNIDLARVHSTGWSNGSHFSFYLACELSDRVASAGGVGGHTTYALQSSCNAERPVSTILIHGTDDILVPYEGIPDLYPPVPTTPEYWVSQNNCSPEPTVTELPDINTEDNSTITRYQYTSCDDETEMDFYVMNDGGHTWPMGGWPESEVWGNVWPAFLGPVNQDINASQVLWDFFERNPYPDLVTIPPGEVYEHSFMLGNTMREYLLYVPAAYDGQEEWPLVLNFHGFSSNAAHQMTVSQMNAVADTGHFLIAYPEGLLVEDIIFGGINQGWSIPGTYGADHDDIEFTSNLIAHIESEYKINRSRIHATGWSNGSELTNYLACELSNKIASVGSVSGGLSYGQLESCNPGRQISTLLIFGTDDLFYPFEGNDATPPVLTTPAFWSSQNNCNQEPIITELPDKDTEDGSTVTRFDYPNCDEDAEVILYRINNGGHTWPGGGPLPEFLGNINRDINASAIIWDFFERHPYPDPFVNTLTLVDAKSNEDIQELKDGDLLDLSELPKSHLNIRAEVYGGAKSVKFELNGEKVSIENFEPYAMFGDNKGDYRSGKFKPGHYELKVTPYTAPNAKGDAGEALKINIQVVKSNTVADIVKRSSEYSILLQALKKSGLLAQLDSEGPYTLFAPDDVAFWKAFKVLGINGIEQIPDYLLRKLLMYHLVNDQILTSDISDGQELSSLLGLPLTLSRNQKYIFINNAYITKADQEATNGVVHTISDLILPDVNALLFGLEALLEDREAAIASINEQVLEIIASPNPGAREVNIITQGMVGKKLTVTIVNYSGLQTKKLEYDLSRKMEETRLDFTDYSKGMYIIHAQVGHLQKDFKVMR